MSLKIIRQLTLSPSGESGELIRYLPPSVALATGGVPAPLRLVKAGVARLIGYCSGLSGSARGDDCGKMPQLHVHTEYSGIILIH
jgi:hypothetical protein